MWIENSGWVEVSGLSGLFQLWLDESEGRHYVCIASNGVVLRFRQSSEYQAEEIYAAIAKAEGTLGDESEEEVRD